MNNYINSRFVLWFFVLFHIIFLQKSLCQTDSAKETNLFLPKNILSFADFLFCQKDYLRAVTEYENYLKTNKNDSVKFKIALSFLNMGKNVEAEIKFSELLIDTELANPSRLEIAKSIFQRKDFSYLESYYKESEINETRIKGNIKILYYFSLLYQEINLPDENEFINTFPNSTLLSIKKFYAKKEDLPHKSPLLASVFSAIIPGAGKIYTGEYSDGITATVLTGLLTFLSYDNFKYNHKFRGWLWGGIAAFFYAGNIYGSAASAQIFNAKIKFDFESELDLFIKQNNYLLPDYGFNCK